MQLAEVLGADVVVEGIPPVHEVRKVPEAEVEEDAEAHHAHDGQHGMAHAPSHVILALGLKATLPQKEKRPQYGEPQLDPCAGVVVPVVEIGLGCRRDGGIHHLHLGWERARDLTIGRHFGNRVEAVTLSLADAEEAHG